MQNSLPITIDDVSPLIEFQPFNAWTQTNSDPDPIGSQYYAETFTWTQQVGATASFTFNGTFVAIYGGKSEQHGNYTVTIDGETTTASGFSPTGQYQAVLFSRDGLNDGAHTVTVTNAQLSVLDIDYITWTSNISSMRSGPISKRLVDDAEENFQYIPTSAWSNRPSNLNRFFSNTGHTTSTSGASVKYNFTGSAVSLFGTVGPDNGAYTVQLDGQAPKSYQGVKPTYTPQTILYHASNLRFGNHTVLITNSGDKKLELDSAIMYKVDSFRFSPTAPMNPDATSVQDQPNGPRLSPAAIFGLSMGALAIFFLVIALCLLVRVNKTLWRRLQRGYMVQSQFDTMSPSTADSEAVSHLTSDNKTSQDPHSPSQLTEPREIVIIGRPPTIRPLSMSSNVSSSASTLVAEDGSNASTTRRGPRFKRRGGQDRGNINAGTNEVPPPVPPLPPQLPHIRPVGRLMTIESVPDLLEHRVMSDVDSEIHIPTVSPSASTASLPNSRRAASLGRSVGPPEASSTRNDWATTSPVQPAGEPEVIEVLGRSTSVLLGNHDTRTETGNSQELHGPPLVAATLSSGSDSASVSGGSSATQTVGPSLRTAPPPTVTPKTSYGSISSMALFRTRRPLDLNYV